MNDPARPEERVLLRMTTARDAGMTGDVLQRAGIQSFACASIEQLIAELALGAGALLIAEETFGPPEQAALVASLAGQPPWSDLMVLLLARTGAGSTAISDAMARFINVTVIERPVRVASLVTAVRATLRARQRQYQVRALFDDLHRVDQRRNEFLATLAHELRNPLAPIKTTLDLLGTGKVAAAVMGRHHDRMRRQVDHITRLVNDLMEVSRITRGKLELKFLPVSLETVLGDAIEQSRPLLASAAHSLTVDLGDDALILDGDAIRLTQVFSNLLNNAAKYTPGGGRIGVTARRDGRHALVEVCDTGIGIEPQMLCSIFDMFVQVGGASKAAQGGLGIGLTLVRTLVELHGGRVEAVSDGLNQGSTMVVRLPLLQAPNGPNARSEPDAAATAVATNGEKRTVLVVDDNRDAADSLTELLQTIGATVLTAYSGDEAVHLASRARVDIAVLDIGMPNMDGFTLAGLLRGLKHGPSMTLIALTGWGQEGDRKRLTAAGFDHHLLKPVDAARLSALL